MVNFMFICSRCLKTELLASKKVTVFLCRTASNKVICIPQRKNRGPLDILETLASTVKTESGVMEYRFQYGGIFDVRKDYSKRVTAMSMDSGRKAAKWIVAHNPRLFQHKYADPYIKAFAPPRTIDENTQLSEETLLEAIQDVEVEEAIKIYKLMKEKDFDVSTATKQLLLEMVCYYNNKNKPDETLIETRYCEETPRVNANTWEKNGFAEELFLEMEPSSESYSALILGRMKYNSINKAFGIYDEAKEKGVGLGVDVYNALLEHATEKAFEHADQEAYIIELLKEMREKNITPNLGTLNSTLKSVTAMRKWLKARHLAVKVFQEFKGIGIQPSLATYYYLLEIFSDHGRVTPAFKEILEEIKNEKFVAKHADDFKFFTKAMEVAVYTFKSISLSHQVHALLMAGSNRYFLSGGLNRNNYYRSYITAAFRFDDLNDAVNILERYVPQAYMPDIVAIMVMITALRSRDGSRFLPRIWPLIEETALRSDRACQELLPLLVDGMTLYGSDDSFVEITKKTWEKYNDENIVVRDYSILTQILKVFAIAEEKTLTDAVFQKAVKIGFNKVELDFESLNLYTDLCISNSDNQRALACVEYAVTRNYPKGTLLAEKVKNKLNLKGDEEQFLVNLLKEARKRGTQERR